MKHGQPAVGTCWKRIDVKLFLSVAGRMLRRREKKILCRVSM